MRLEIGVNKLTPKQQRFVEEYLVDANATQAAVRAGYSERTARQMGAENLSKPVVAAAIEDAQKKRSGRVEVTQDYVLQALTEVVERCLQRAPVMVRKGREIVQLTDAEGRHVWSFDARGVIGAAALLAKHTGGFTERHEHTGVVHHRLARMAPDELKRVEHMSDDEIRELIGAGASGAGDD